MGWRTVVVTKPAKLDLRLGYLVVRDSEDNVRVHISEISVLLIENIRTSVTAALLCELSRQKVKVIFCDEKLNPYGELIPYYGGFDSSLSIRNQINWSEDEDMASFCHNELPEQTFAVKRAVTDFIGAAVEEFDFDFTFQEEVLLQDIFKMQSLRPDTASDSVLESLHEYIVLIQKYAPVRCFVILGLHQNFSPSELAPFYKELTGRKIRLLDIESTTDFMPSSWERLTVIDEDLCEIVEKER